MKLCTILAALAATCVCLACDSSGKSGAGSTTGGAAGEAGASGGSASERCSRAARANGAAGAAGAAGEDPERVAWVTQPTFAGNENPAVPQAGVLSFETDVPATTTVTVSGGDEEWSLTFRSEGEVEKPIVGLKPGVTYTMNVCVFAEDNALSVDDLEWTTPELPELFPRMETVLTTPDEMEPGMTLFDVYLGGQDGDLVIVDHEGVVRWYYAPGHNLDDHRRLPNGNFMFVAEDCWIGEVDLLGNMVRSWQATEGPIDCPAPRDSTPVAADSFHHEAAVLANGNLLTLSTESRMVDDVPTSGVDADAPTETATVVGSVVLEFSPDGDVVKHISLLDLLDPTRVGQELHSAWNLGNAYGEEEDPVDWDHANGVVYDEDAGAYYVSLRNQDAIVKIDRESEELLWILGTPSNWREPWSEKLLTPDGELEWPYHQHALELTPDGLGLYDNGNFRAAAFEEPREEYSRAVLYSIDEEDMTVSEAWSYGEPGENSFFSQAMGDADWQPKTGNVLIVNGWMSVAGPPTGSIVEVTASGERLFELRTMPTPGQTVVTIYRAQRLADIRK